MTMSQVTKNATNKIDVSKVAKKVDLTVLRKVSTTEKGHMYHVRSAKTGDDYYLLIKGEDPGFNPNHDYEVAVAGSKGNKQIWATVPVQYTALNDSIVEEDDNKVVVVEDGKKYKGHNEYEIMDKMDEHQIIAELQNAIVDKLFYSFYVGGRKVTGISVAGVKSYWNKRGNLHFISKEFSEDADFIYCTVVMRDLTINRDGVGFVAQPKFETRKDGSEYAVNMPKRVAFGKAKRNALRDLMPEETIIELMKKWEDNK